MATVADLGDYVEKSGDSMTNNLTNVGTLSGSTCTADPIYGHLPMFSSTNKVLEDSTYSVFDMVTGPTSAIVNNIPVFSSTSGKQISASTSTIDHWSFDISGASAGLGVNGRIFSADNHWSNDCKSYSRAQINYERVPLQK